jgi:hypothetical protein
MVGGSVCDYGHRTHSGAAEIHQGLGTDKNQHALIVDEQDLFATAVGRDAFIRRRGSGGIVYSGEINLKGVPLSGWLYTLRDEPE